MLRDEIILELVPKADVELKPQPLINLDIDSLPIVPVSLDLDPTRVIIIDLQNLVDQEGAILHLYGKVARAILFTKAVLGRKKTFGKSALVIVNNIQTSGVANNIPSNHNLVALPIVFGKSVLGRKTTFARISLTVVTDITTTPSGGPVGVLDFYGDGLYGADTYGSNPSPLNVISFNVGFGSTISGSTPFKQTAIAEISLASHGNPSVRTNHSIKIRARTTSGSGGIIKAALYEGAVNRSGDLFSAPLSNSLANYTLPIPDVAAASITDYSNLSIRFWGYDVGGNPLVFEIADIYLELPVGTGSTQYGSVSRSITFTKAVSGNIGNKKTTTAEISLASHGIPSVRTNHVIKVRARTVSGSNGVIKAALYEGAINRSGDLISQPLTNTLADYDLIILDSLAATINDYSNLSIKFWGFDLNNSGLVFEVSKIYLQLPTSSGNVTWYGSISRAITFTKAVSGVIVTSTKYGALVRAITFVKAVSGIIKSKRTATAEISLASHGTPSVRTNHTIKVRARTVSGSTGVLKAELYEGTTVRSGSTPLVTSPLTNTLADYSLAIPDASVAAITSYSNLSIKFWGFDSAGNALVFEVSKIYLELPTP